jgi:hypothetical protein
VPVRGVLAEDEPGRDLLVAEALGDEGEHLRLARGEPGDARLVPARDLGLDLAHLPGSAPCGMGCAEPLETLER